MFEKHKVISACKFFFEMFYRFLSKLGFLLVGGHSSYSLALCHYRYVRLL